MLKNFGLFPLKDGLKLHGRFLSEIGSGEAARQMAYAAQAAGVEFRLANIRTPNRENIRIFERNLGASLPRRAEMLIGGLDDMVHGLKRLSRRVTKIAFPFWELSELPGQMREVANAYDQIWAPSRFVADSFRSSVRRPVKVLNQAVHLPDGLAPQRSGRTTLRVFTFFDTDSFVSRKNPKAAIRAFQLAFGEHRSDVEMNVKLRGHKDGGIRDWLSRRAAADRRIKIIDGFVSRAELDKLMTDSDVFLSLHRSEGFGFGPAEAMANGKAVIATDYSATTDFLSAQTGYPVAYRLVPVKPDDYIYADGQHWADPEIEDAARALQKVYDDPADAAGRAKAGYAFLSEHFSARAVGAKMKSYLQALA